jgi:hypothetical protein
MQTDAAGPGHGQRARRGPADPQPARSTPPSCSGCCRSCSSNCPRSATRTSRVLVFFFDEAHLLFDDAPKVLVDKVEQVVRLIRSKGVGVYFVTQSPMDVPDDVLGQLGNRVQHALRAFTPKGPEGGARRGPDLPPESGPGHRGRPSPRWASARRWPRPSTTTASPASCSASRWRRRAAGSAHHAEQRRALMAQLAGGRGLRAVVDRDSAYETLKLMAEQAALAAETLSVTPPARSAPAHRRAAAPRRRWRPSRQRHALAGHADRSPAGARHAGSLFGGQRRRIG